MLSQVILTVRDDLLFGSVIYPGGVFAVEPGQFGLHRISEIDQSKFLEDTVDWVADDRLSAYPTVQAPLTDDGSTLDVLVAYTDDVLPGSGVVQTSRN